MIEKQSKEGNADRPGAKEAQPWHAADEKRKEKSAPVGTHSLTGGGAEVGMPTPPEANGAERSERPSDSEADAPAKPDPLAEPRANLGEILGNKP